MFIGFYYHLRRRGLAVALQEWLDLMEALARGLAGESLAGFYFLCRSLTVKREAQFDLYDQCFAEYFRGVEAPPGLKEELLEWLQGVPLPRQLSPEEMERLKSLDLDELRRQFEERLREQQERHDGGSRWIGTGGTSPFGHSGYHPSGVRVGGEGRWRSAMQVASARRFRNLRTDQTLDTRQIGLALKKLRVLARDGGAEELDIDASIAATARAAGEVELVFRPPRKNNVKLVLLMDVGGSMTAHTRVSEQLFTAAHGVNHFKEFRSYYFHNCPYESLYTDMQRLDAVPTADLLAELDSSWLLLVVGDAAMSPYELTVPGGSVDYFHHNEEPGLVWLARIKARLPRAAWLNPEPVEMWAMPSIQLVRRVFTEMYPLTLDGLGEAVERLRTGAFQATS